MGRHHRWLVALFGAAFVVDLVVAGVTGAGVHLLGAAGMLVCVGIGLRRPGVAAGVAALVLGCLAATGLRAEFPPDGRTLSFGFAVLVCGTAAGWYLRRPVRSDWDVLLHRQRCPP